DAGGGRGALRPRGRRFSRRARPALRSRERFTMQRFVLTLSCPDRMGIVAAVSAFLLEHRCNIVDSAQFGDAEFGRFFMRVCFDAESPASAAGLADAFAPIAGRFDMDYRLHDTAVKSRMLILVSRFGHCLNDLLYRHRVGALPVERPSIESTHRNFEHPADAHGIPFHYLPVTPETRARQEQHLREIIDSTRADLVVLARYMQILSPELCRHLRERAINIHHS